ncbi:type IV pilin protein [Luteolibacter algae]|uniref:Type IV pilin protein n=1 Tax=Luteolibacter algae TaxID=454151 RepID=A0ABW5D271_9BACT
MKKRIRPHASGFTLLELLVTTAIIATLAGISATGYLSLRQKARMVTEINAAKNLITAYLSYPSDHNGQVMPGYQSDPEVTDLDGRPLASPMNARYPWRLAANAPRIDGVMLFNGNETALDEQNSDYLVSVKPNLGINAVFLGGHFGSGSPLPPSPRLLEAYGKFHLTHLAEAHAPEELIVFSSARSGKDSPGYFEIRSPKLTRPIWSSTEFSEDSPASSHGFVDFRYDGKTVTACLAGNVQLMDEDEMRDMRHWSNQAAIENDPDFLIRVGSN